MTGRDDEHQERREYRNACAGETSGPIRQLLQLVPKPLPNLPALPGRDRLTPAGPAPMGADLLSAQT